MVKTVEKEKKGFQLKDFYTKKNLPFICIIILGIYTIASILISYFALEIPIVPLCMIVILEALLAALLNKIPLWVHGLVFILEIVIGVIASKAAFMVLMAFVYAIAVVFLYIWSRNE